MRQTRRGFTLVEMLVVMVIIGILISMLLPALNGVREQARRTNCSVNMRQIGLGMLAFESARKVLPNGGEGVNQNKFLPLDPIAGTWSTTTNGNYFKTAFCNDFWSTASGYSWKYPKEAHVGPFAQILPYLEQAAVYGAMDSSKNYRQTDANFTASQQKIQIYVCPSDPWGTQDTDPSSCGKLDYFATVYTDIWDSTDGTSTDTSTTTAPNNNGVATLNYGERGKDGTAVLETINGQTNIDVNVKCVGALSLPAAPVSAITDGTSQTILCVEDAGRQHQNQASTTSAPYHVPIAACYSKYADNVCAGSQAGTLGAADCLLTNWDKSGYGASGDIQTANGHGVSRWADPDAGGSGVSGPPTVDPAATHAPGTYSQNLYVSGYTNEARPYTHWVNQNSVMGGTTSGTAICPWFVNNCGLNDEPFSFHPNGCNAVFCDGSVRFLSETITPIAMKALVTRADGANKLPQDEWPK